MDAAIVSRSESRTYRMPGRFKLHASETKVTFTLCGEEKAIKFWAYTEDAFSAVLEVELENLGDHFAAVRGNVNEKTASLYINDICLVSDARFDGETDADFLQFVK